MKIKYILISFLVLLPSILLSQTMELDIVEPEPDSGVFGSGQIEEIVNATSKQDEQSTHNALVTEEKEPDPFETFAIFEKEPKQINFKEVRAAMGYPTISKENNIQGKVVVRMLIDKEGRYIRHIVVKDPHPDLTKAVNEHISKLQYTPGIQAGKAILAWVTVLIDFRLD